jgi:hypothetical protein
MNMGIGTLGFSNMVFKRKFRYTFQVTNICSGAGTIPPDFVKIAARPSLTIEETEINYLNARTWIPGKATWETITVTYIDAAVSALQPLYNWLGSVYNFFNPVTLQMGSSVADYTGTGILILYDGCGTALEQWTLGNLWPQAINWGELDYASSDETNIELTLRYTNVLYQQLCPPYSPNPCCTPCSSS